MSGEDRRPSPGQPGAGQPGDAGLPDAPGQQRDAPSRRSVLRGAAGAGAAGLAASAVAGASLGPAMAVTAGRTARRQRGGYAEAQGTGRPPSDVVVHLRDPRSGEMDIFSGTSQIRLRDRDLAARLLRAIS